MLNIKTDDEIGSDCKAQMWFCHVFILRKFLGRLTVDVRDVASRLVLNQSSVNPRMKYSIILSSWYVSHKLY